MSDTTPTGTATPTTAPAAPTTPTAAPTTPPTTTQAPTAPTAPVAPATPTARTYKFADNTPQEVADTLTRVGNEFGFDDRQMAFLATYQSALNTTVPETPTAQKPNYTPGLNKLKAEWGERLPENINTVHAFTTELEKQVPGVIDMFNQTGAFENPLVIRLLHHMASIVTKPGARPSQSRVVPQTGSGVWSKGIDPTEYL